MKIQLIKIIAALIAGGLVMILHEIPKSILFTKMNAKQDKKRKYDIYKLLNYIDPIGLILCITNQVGFSKPYMYRIKDKKTNLILGITGFSSLVLIFIVSTLILKFGIKMKSNFSYSETIGVFELFYECIILYISLISLSMIIVNLFPISVFDIGLIIAGKSSKAYFNIIRFDYITKIILLFTVLLQIVSTGCTFLLSLLL